MQTRTLMPADAAVAATAAIGDLASGPATSPWYRSLRKSVYQPPQQAFPIAWPALYADVTIVPSNALDEMDRDARRKYSAALASWCAPATMLAGHVWFLDHGSG